MKGITPIRGADRDKQRTWHLVGVILFGVLASALFVFLMFKLWTSRPDVDLSKTNLSDQAVAQRLRPVGADAASMGMIAPKNSVSTPFRPAKALYDSACAVCHDSGLQGAPRRGNSADWSPRLEKGMAAVMAAARQGTQVMPPRGGLVGADVEFKAAVQYLIQSTPTQP